VRNILPLSLVITLFQSCDTAPELTRGDALRFRSALAPGFPIPRLLALSDSIQTFEASQAEPSTYHL